MDKRFKKKKEDIWIGGVIIFYTITVILPLFLIIHGSFFIQSGLQMDYFDENRGMKIGIAICELVGGVASAIFWIKSYLESKKEEKFKISIIDNGICYDCKILAYSTEIDQMEVPECVVIYSNKQIFILGVNNVLIPDEFKVGSTNKLFMRQREDSVDILVTNYEVNDITSTIDNKLHVPQNIVDKYMKVYSEDNKFSGEN